MEGYQNRNDGRLGGLMPGGVIREPLAEQYVQQAIETLQGEIDRQHQEIMELRHEKESLMAELNGIATNCRNLSDGFRKAQSANRPSTEFLNGRN